MRNWISMHGRGAGDRVEGLAGTRLRWSPDKLTVIRIYSL